MMKKTPFLMAILLTGLLGCKQADIEKDVPSCVRQEVRSFAGSACKDEASAKEYVFQRKTVYVLDPGNCGNDLAAEVIDEECNSIGFLGGIAGNTKINGEEFSNASLVRIIWEDDK